MTPLYARKAKAKVKPGIGGQFTLRMVDREWHLSTEKGNRSVAMAWVSAIQAAVDRRAVRGMNTDSHNSLGVSQARARLLNIGDELGVTVEEAMGFKSGAETQVHVAEDADVPIDSITVDRDSTNAPLCDKKVQDPGAIQAVAQPTCPEDPVRIVVNKQLRGTFGLMFGGVNNAADAEAKRVTGVLIARADRAMSIGTLIGWQVIEINGLDVRFFSFSGLTF